jgi:hypothetical protein
LEAYGPDAEGEDAAGQLLDLREDLAEGEPFKGALLIERPLLLFAVDGLLLLVLFDQLPLAQRSCALVLVCRKAMSARALSLATVALTAPYTLTLERTL